MGLVLFSCAVLAPALAWAGDANRASCPNEAMLGFEAYLPDCRAYEMVSPSYKEGYLMSPIGVSRSGSQVFAESFGTLLNPQGQAPEGTGVLGHSYRLTRGATGWTAAAFDIAASAFPDFAVHSTSPELASSVWYAAAPGHSSDDIYLQRAPGTPLLRMGPGTPPDALETALAFRGASEDQQRALFLVHSPNVGIEENQLWPGDTTDSEVRPSLYEYLGTGHEEPSLVGVSDQHRLERVSDSHLISNCGTVLGGHQPGDETFNAGGDAYNAISSSGELVFFTAEECAGSPAANELYARVNGERTIAISEPSLSTPGRECTGECEAAETDPANRRAGVFAGASYDGSNVFFTTTQPLVNGDTDHANDLYEAHITSGILTSLTQISRGAGDPAPGAAAEVLGVARVSEDGSHVYYVAAGTLTGPNGEGRSPIAGDPNLYVSSLDCPGEGTCPNPTERTSFIATLSSQDGQDWGAIDRRPVQATPDGQFLVFQSAADLTADQQGRTEAGQIFEYDASSETLIRVSKGQDGYNEDGHSASFAASIPSQNYETDQVRTRFTHLALSSDGSRVLFTTDDALTPEALPGIVNVYEYQAGHVALISDGHDLHLVLGETSPTELIGIDESGQDVFFTTADPLVPGDHDTQLDVYDARSDGGFPQPALAPDCSQGACKGSGSAPPPLPTPAVSPIPEAPVAIAPVLPAAPKKVVPKAKRRRCVPAGKRRAKHAARHGCPAKRSAHRRSKVAHKEA